MKRTRVGIVGFGVMGARHARVFGALDSDFEIAGALDPNGSKIPAFLRHFMRLEDLIDACDLVIVSNPIESHAAAVMRSLERGRHVLVEKPIAATAKEARTLVDRAKTSSGHLFVGHSERFHPVVRALAAELRGQHIRAMHFRRITSGTPRDASLRTCEADALLNLAVHDIDLAAYLARSGASLQATSFRNGVASIDLALADGAHVRIETGRTDSPERTMTLETDQGAYHADFRASTLRLTHRDPLQNKVFSLSNEEPLSAQATAVATILEGDTAPIANGEDGARAVAIAEEALLLLGAPMKAAENL